MRKTLLLKRPLIFFVVIVLLFVACNNEKSSPAKTDTLNTSTNATPTPVPAKPTLLTGYLDTLWMESKIFDTLKKKLTFRFYIDSSNSLTIRGWSSDNGKYYKDPDVILFTGRVSKLEYGRGNYFGNLLLEKKNVTDIQDSIAKYKSTYVLFAPVDPATATNKGQITYNILVTNDDPRPSVNNFTASSATTGVTANPSPPRNAY